MHLKSKGMEKGTIYVLSVLAEQQVALQNDTRDLAMLLDQMMNVMNNLTLVGENMKNAVESLRSADKDDDGLGPSTQLLGRKDMD